MVEEIEKREDVKIISITADPTNGQVFGLGDDQNMYLWYHMGEHGGAWILYITD